jgi:prevent-host-death family protein
MKTEIGAYDAKTRLPELLRQVKAGKRFTITNRGEAIADLVPSEAGRTTDAKSAIEKFQAFLRGNPVKAPLKIDVKALIDEGRE